MEKEILGSIEMALFQIHSIAKILEKEAMDNDYLTDYNNISNEHLSLSQIIAEKAEFCLDAINDNHEDEMAVTT
jgi:hypothetical protein